MPFFYLFDRATTYTSNTGITRSILIYQDFYYPEDPIVSALIDDGKNGKPDRFNLYDNTFTHVGVSWGCHSTKQEMCCILLSQNVIEKDPTLVSSSAPQLSTCSAYTKTTADTTTGSIALQKIVIELSNYQLTLANKKSILNFCLNIDIFLDKFYKYNSIKYNFFSINFYLIDIIF